MAELKRLIVLTASYEGGAMAWQAQREGLDVILGVIPKWEETLTKDELKEDDGKEEPEDLKRRMQTYDGMVPKVPATKLLKMLEKLSDEEKAETFVYCDMNYTFKYAEQLAKLGVPGNYPTEEDRMLESDREAGKKFVEKYYGGTGLKVGELQNFNSVEDGLKFLEEQMKDGGDEGKLWVLKGNNSGAETIVPLPTDTPEQAFATMKTALENDPDSYQSEGFILEEFIRDAMEITPQAYFWDGKLVATSIDIEIKKKGSGLSGRTVGCAANLIVPTPLDSPINRIAFPPKIYEMAKGRKGLFLWDASILINPENGDLYFGEFCCNRFGYDQTQTDMVISGGVKNFFESLMNGKSPYDNKVGKFGFAVRMFNEIDDSDLPKRCAMDIPLYIDEEVAEYVFPLYVYKDGEEMKSSGYGEDLAIVGCAMDTIEQAAQGCYEYMEKISFKDYSRLSLDDVLSTRTAGTILNRFNYGNGNFYDVPNGEPKQQQAIESVAKPEPPQPPKGQEPEPEHEAPKFMRFVEELMEKSQQLAQENELLRLSNVGTAQRESGLINTFTSQMSTAVKEFRGSIEEFKLLNGKVSDVGLLQTTLLAIQQGLKPLENMQYIVKTSDRLGTVEKLLLELIELQKQPKADKLTPAFQKYFDELKQSYEEQTDKTIKANRENITVISGGQHYDIPPNLPTIQNISLATAGTEYPCTIPLGTKRIQFKIRGLVGNTLRYGWNAGDTTGTAYLTLEQGESALISGVRILHDSTIYFNCPDSNSVVVEVETWTA